MGGDQEEVVKEFVRELQSIVETRPPISKAKMMSITKSALKGIKFYKHIVMNVEKFIAKCKPEYKIPGLYVIDSVIRQSRHQYGVEKDVYGARFAKNILNTLQHLEKCPTDDQDKITRVLNLWEKNAIFPADLLKQLFQEHQSNGNIEPSSSKVPYSIDKSTSEKLPGGHDFDRLRELQESLKRASGQTESDTTSILTEIQQITNQLLGSQKKPSSNPNSGDEPSSTVNSTEPMQSNVAHVLDDFDYDSDNDDDEPRGGSTVVNPSSTFLPKNLPPPMQFLQPPAGMFLNTNHPNTVSFPITDANNMSISMSFDPSRPPPIFFQQPLPSSLSVPPPPHLLHQHPQPTDVDLRPEDMDDDSHQSSPSHPRYDRRRSRSRSREPKRSRSSSNSNNRNDSAASRLKETERRERRRKGLPPLKEDHLVVSSRTLWLGHLPKMISEIDLREHLEPHGEINDINNIPPRGCAFVCFKERADAARCLEKMKDFRFHGNPIKIAWAMNKGVKDRFKEYWDTDHGCTYIPYSEVKDISSLTMLAEGGVIDEESVPAFLKPATVPSIHPDVSSQIHRLPPTTSFAHQDFAMNPNLQSAPPTVRLESPNRLATGQTLLMPPPQESPIRVSLPLQMMPPGAQIIQVQSHPHGQPVQLVQRIAGPVFSNSQIIHQMPFGHVVTTNHPPSTLQFQHRPGEFKDLNGQTMGPGGGLHLLTNPTALPSHHPHHHHHQQQFLTTGGQLTNATFAQTIEGPTLIQFPNDAHRRMTTPSPSSGQFDEHHRPHLTSTEEQLVRLSTSSSSATHFPAHMASHPPSLLGASPSPVRPPHHPNQFAGPNLVGHLPPPGLLPTPSATDEHSKPAFPRRPNRFAAREEPTPAQEAPPYRPEPSGIPRGMNRGRGGNGYDARGYFSNNPNDRIENNDNDNGGYRNRGGYNRGGRPGPSRFSFHGSNPRGNDNEHSSTHRSSRSPDRHSSSYRHDHHQSTHSRGHSDSSADEFSHRSLPAEALRRREKPPYDSSALIIDESLSNRSGHVE